MRVLEEDRQAKIIGKGLEAQLRIDESGELLALLKRHEAGLKEILNVSSCERRRRQRAEDHGASPASGHKCARCWNFMPEVSELRHLENVCTRCQSALQEMGIAPPQADGAQTGGQQ